jgi:hypothetical protein
MKGYIISIVLAYFIVVGVGVFQMCTPEKITQVKATAWKLERKDPAQRWLSDNDSDPEVREDFIWLVWKDLLSHELYYERVTKIEGDKYQLGTVISTRVPR